MKVRRFKKAAEGDEEQQQQEGTEPPSQKDVETLFLQVIEQNISFLSLSLVLGLALVLIKANIGSKEELAKMKPAVITNKIYAILKMVVSDRQTLKQELRLLWRYGAKTYAARKIRELKSAVGA